MRSFIMAGVLVGSVLAAARAAEAQVVVKPVGPACVESDDLLSTYVADVETNYDFWFRLQVIHRGEVKHDSTTYVVNSGPSYHFTKDVDHTGWGMVVGDVLTYRGRATIAAGPYQGRYHERDWQVTVSAPGTCRVCEILDERAPRRRGRGICSGGRAS